MKAEAQIMAGLLHHGVQFLGPISGEKKTELVRNLARDAHELFTRLVWEETDLSSLFRQWFREGREYEKGEPTLNLVPANVDSALKDIIARETQTSFTRLGTDLSFLCCLVWVWFQRGRSYQRGNAT